MIEQHHTVENQPRRGMLQDIFFADGHVDVPVAIHWQPQTFTACDVGHETFYYPHGDGNVEDGPVCVSYEEEHTCII